MAQSLSVEQFLTDKHWWYMPGIGWRDPTRPWLFFPNARDAEAEQHKRDNSGNQTSEVKQEAGDSTA